MTRPEFKAKMENFKWWYEKLYSRNKRYPMAQYMLDDVVVRLHPRAVIAVCIKDSTAEPIEVAVMFRALYEEIEEVREVHIPGGAVTLSVVIGGKEYEIGETADEL